MVIRSKLHRFELYINIYVYIHPLVIETLHPILTLNDPSSPIL